ncbi:MAG TPA: LuxR C-terminal-related transcriptional regulator [Gemmatimonadales bacterium]|nr:LuxR C-terminal-related transcriptional regulator [Gemmatimonadales bacterium]
MVNSPDMPDDTPPRLDGVAAVLLILISLTVGFDIVLDRPTTLWSIHVAVELLVVILCLVLAVLLWNRWRLTVRELDRARRALVSREAERDAWAAAAAEAVRGFRAAINDQFAQWKLTPTEREVAILLLEGLGHRQIARESGRSERTVRQHAVTIYDKSGLDGRAALAGFFLRGLRDTAPTDE